MNHAIIAEESSALSMDTESSCNDAKMLMSSGAGSSLPLSSSSSRSSSLRYLRATTPQKMTRSSFSYCVPNQRKQKHLQFENDDVLNQVIEIESLKDLLKEDLELRWYSQREQSFMKRQALFEAELSRQVRSESNNSSTTSPSALASIEARGIEHYICDHRMGVIRSRGHAALQTVLYSQEELRGQVVEERDQLVAALYQDVSVLCAKEAHIRGLKDMLATFGEEE
jgi:hypothetical protein